MIRSQSVQWKSSDGIVPYEDAVRSMELQVAKMRAGHEAELVWLIQHPPLYTAGASAKSEDLVDPDRFPVHHTGRGGQYTYHGPGQRIAYVMLDLNHRGRDVRMFVRRLENWLIETLTHFDIQGERRQGRVGIWVKGNSGKEFKIGAIGVRVRHWITYHGVSLNVCPNLEHYEGIVPCGIREHGVTSLADLGIGATLADVDAALQATFEQVFNH